jgi:hypothetical protein
MIEIVNFQISQLFKSYSIGTNTFYSYFDRFDTKNPVGMVNFVAVDFNPRLPINYFY